MSRTHIKFDKELVLKVKALKSNGVNITEIARRLIIPRHQVSKMYDMSDDPELDHLSIVRIEKTNQHSIDFASVITEIRSTFDDGIVKVTEEYERLKSENKLLRDQYEKRIEELEEQNRSQIKNALNGLTKLNKIAPIVEDEEPDNYDQESEEYGTVQIEPCTIFQIRSDINFYGLGQQELFNLYNPLLDAAAHRFGFPVNRMTLFGNNTVSVRLKSSSDYSKKIGMIFGAPHIDNNITKFNYTLSIKNSHARQVLNLVDVQRSVYG